MQKNELISNGISLDLAPNTIVGITYQANDLGELQNRQGNFSNTFKLPFTEKNRKFFENAEDINSGTAVPYRRFLADYYESGLPIIRDGIMTLVEVDNGYSVRLNSGNTDFFNLLGDKTVGDLYIGENHVMNFDTIVDSLAEAEDYIYPTIDFRRYPDAGPLQPWDNGMDVRWFRPCLFVKKIIQRMEAEYDYTINGTFTESELFDKLLLTPDNCVNPDDVDYNFNSSLIIGSPLTIGNIPEAPIGDSFTYFEAVNTTPNAILTVTVDSITTPIGGSGTMKLNYDFQAFISMTDTPIIEYDRRKGIIVEVLKIGTGIIATETLISEEVYAEDWYYTALGAMSFPYTVSEGDEYYARILFEIQEADNTGFDYGFSEPVTVSLTFEPQQNVTYGGVVFLENMFNIKQKDFLKDLINIGCVLPQTNSFTRTFTLNFVDDLLTNTDKALDWSNKIDTNSINVTYNWGDYGQTNIFKYKPIPNINEQYQTGFSDGSFSIDDVNLPIEKTIVELTTSATQESLDAIIMSVQAVDPTNGNWTNPNNRFLIADRRTDLDDYYKTLIDTYGNVYVNPNPLFTYFLLGELCLAFDAGLFPVTGLRDRYYKAIQQITYKTKYIEVFAFLTSNDVRNIDFTTPIFLNVQHGKVNINGYFYLNIVSQYKGGLTKIGLVRL